MENSKSFNAVRSLGANTLFPQNNIKKSESPSFQGADTSSFATMKTRLFILVAALTAGTALHAAALPEAQKIDSFLSKEWQKNNLKPNAPASDEVMVRRLYLDIAGRIPSVEEAQEFMQSKNPGKRAELVDKLLASDGFTSNMFNYWADILRLSDNVKGRITAEAYAEYVKDCLKKNKPYDQFVRDLMTTEGGVWDSGAIGFYQRDDNKLDHLAYTVQVFLGTSIVCAQCHNHPFDKWTQMDYYGMAAFTYGMDTKGYGFTVIGKGGNKAGAPALKGMTKEERKKYLAEHKEEIQKQMANREGLAEVRKSLQDVLKPLRYTNVTWNEKELPSLPKDYKYPDAKGGQTIQAKTLFGHNATPVEGQTRITAFANWMASPENPRFTTVIANRMWKKAFGIGLIEPVDEITDSTVASNTELMDYLSQLMIEKKYSIKDFLRVLYNTDGYQRSATATEVPLGEVYHFTGPVLRRMSAEQIWDSMVLLAKGNVDGETSEQNARLHTYLGDLKSLVDNMREKGTEGLIEAAKRNNEAHDEDQKKIEELRKQALASGDKEMMKEVADKANALRKKNSNDMLTAILGEERAEDLRKGYVSSKGGKGGKGGNQITPEMRAALAAMSKEERRNAIALGTTMTLTHRASEISSPAKPGHFLRTFGQSDRELISNANDEPSVPQALALLNGPASEVLNNPLSKMRLSLSKAATTEEKLDMLYQSFLCRAPTAQEKVILGQVIQERGDKAVNDVTHAIITGSQFLYIQ